MHMTCMVVTDSGPCSISSFFLPFFFSFCILYFSAGICLQDRYIWCHYFLPTDVWDRTLKPHGPILTWLTSIFFSQTNIKWRICWTKSVTGRMPPANSHFLHISGTACPLLDKNLEISQSKSAMFIVWRFELSPAPLHRVILSLGRFYSS